jgi:hypothetical protein
VPRSRHGRTRVPAVWRTRHRLMPPHEYPGTVIHFLSSKTSKSASVATVKPGPYRRYRRYRRKIRVYLPSVFAGRKLVLRRVVGMGVLDGPCHDSL